MQSKRVIKMKKNAMHLAVIAAAMLSAGCVSTQLTQDAHKNISEATATAKVGFETARPIVTREAYEKSQEVDAPYIVAKSVPLSRTVAMPRALQKDVKTAIMFPEHWVSLGTAAERIMLATGLVVNIAPDVYLENSALQRKSSKDAGGGAAAGGQPAFAAMPPAMPVALAPTPMPLPLPSNYGNGETRPAVASASASSSVRPPESANGFDFPRVEAPLSQILDIVATRLSIKWRYDEASNSIRFYRLVTKSWQTPFSTAKSHFSTAMEGGTSNSTNSNVVTPKNQTSPISSEVSDLVELNSIRDSVDTILTRSGSISANPATGTITLTDTADTVDAADELIQREIKVLSRVVSLRVQTIQVTTNNSGETGVDLSAAISRALKNLPDFTLSLGSPASLTSTNAGSIGLNVYSGSAAGSSAFLKALQQIGDVQTSTELPLTTRNRSPVYYNVRNTFSYVSATTAAAATTGGTGGTPGITTAQDSVGLKLMMYPNVTSKDTVMLTMALDQSILQSLDTFSSGTGANMQSVQLPNVNGEGSSSQVPIRNGQTIVLTGFDRKGNQYDKRTLGDHLPIFAGGSLHASETRSTTIVLVSVDVRDVD
jgi:type IVB pilus formation R64 PilN family outer membrane protein